MRQVFISLMGNIKHGMWQGKGELCWGGGCVRNEQIISDVNNQKKEIKKNLL